MDHRTDRCSRREHLWHRRTMLKAGGLAWLTPVAELLARVEAVLRRSASELPFDFVLNDGNSMVQGGGISSATSVSVSARVSRTGDALNTTKELGANSPAVDPRDTGNLSLVIDVVSGS